MEGKNNELNPETVAPGVESLFRRHSRNRESERFQKEKPVLQKYAVLTGAFLVVLLYLLLPFSRVRSVRIEGSRYLNDSYIRALAKVSPGSIYYLVFGPSVSYNIAKDPMIASASVRLEKDNRITIQVKENKIIGYRYREEGSLLFADGSETPLKSEFLDIIAKVPYLTGFDDAEKTRLLCKAFADVDENVISDIAEITQYPLTYDEEAILILMRNGGYIVANYYNADIVSQYNSLYSRLKNKKQCIYAVDKDYQAAAYSEACPWDKEKVEKEYWKDEEGNLIKNSYGDYAVKNYYYDAEGEYALDVNGEKIPVPINDKGDEVRDEDFVEHYENGYYSTGVLQMPEEAGE